MDEGNPRQVCLINLDLTLLSLCLSLCVHERVSHLFKPRQTLFDDFLFHHEKRLIPSVDFKVSSFLGCCRCVTVFGDSYVKRVFIRQIRLTFWSFKPQCSRRLKACISVPCKKKKTHRLTVTNNNHTSDTQHPHTWNRKRRQPMAALEPKATAATGEPHPLPPDWDGSQQFVLLAWH